jgi:pantothenate kinase
MPAKIANLVATAADQIESSIRERNAQFVALAGIPGAGKSTVAAELQKRFPRAVVLPMDGYHLPRHQLDTRVARRRGAPHTFAKNELRADLVRLKETGAGAFPIFDHTHGDPIENAVHVDPQMRPVLVEGLYLLMADWRVAALFDLRVFLDCSLDVAMERVAARHIACGLAADSAAAQWRVETNDRLNAELILADGCRERADIVVPAG